ncbi:hypothetical protein [Breoghania sp.]|uniref:hypothetical protein n=1 Tax=Breoghania sp. TaxID=2065378 RepID=UPI00261E2FC1|nr:hypothetical protein [Breoghania sp.]MDJ0933427.1 hypothetical protein [Breoghania sp.]
MASQIGLASDWSYKIIKQVGNYGKVYDRNLGAESTYGLDRTGTANALYVDGGLMHPQPIR